LFSELSDDNQRIAQLLGADLNESSMSWTSSLATPIISSFVVTPLHNSTLGSLKKDPKDGSCFLLPSKILPVVDNLLLMISYTVYAFKRISVHDNAVVTANIIVIKNCHNTIS